MSSSAVMDRQILAGHHSAPKVSPQEYTAEYYLTDAEGKEEYLDTKGTELSPRLTKAWKLASVKRGMHVLDLGYGRGEILYHCATYWARVVGIDYSPDAKSLAEDVLSQLEGESLERVRLICGDMREVPYPDNSFDRVFMLDIVEHLSPEELETVLREARRVLKPGGVCVIHTMPNRLYWDVAYRYYMKWVDALVGFVLRGKLSVRHEGRNHYSQKVHINEQTRWNLKGLLQSCGFGAKVWLEDDFFHAKNLRRCRAKELFYEAVLRLWPLSNLWPLKEIFHHSIYALATKETD